jgi:hypothetical protein
MSKRKPKQSARKWAAEVYRRYIDECETAGGFPEEWHEYFVREYLAMPNATKFVVSELLKPLSMLVWHDDPSGIADDEGSHGELFRTLDGYKLERTYTFEDPRSASGYARVKDEFASIRQMGSDAIITLRKSDEVAAVARQKIERHAAALEKASGNQDALLSDVWDRDEGEDAA